MLFLYKCIFPSATIKKALYLFLIICFNYGMYGYSQQLPAYISNRVTIQSGDTSITLHLLSKDKKVKPKSDRYYFWYKTQVVRYTCGGYDGRLLDGEYIEMYPDKNIKIKGRFRKGLRNGTWVSWNQQGEYAAIINWRNGLKEGAFKEYNAGGHLLRSGTYLNDQLNGQVTEYAEDGKNITKRYNKGMEIHKQEDKNISDSLIAKPNQ